MAGTISGTPPRFVLCPFLSNIDNIGYHVYPSIRELIRMNVSLTPELERLVNEKVESGLYQTASEVVREALRLLKERDHATRAASC